MILFPIIENIILRALIRGVIQDHDLHQNLPSSEPKQRIDLKMKKGGREVYQERADKRTKKNYATKYFIIRPDSMSCYQQGFKRREPKSETNGK